jgi:hypothetical protein
MVVDGTLRVPGTGKDNFHHRPLFLRLHVRTFIIQANDMVH